MIHILYAYVSEEKHKNLLEEFLPEFPMDFQTKITSSRRWQDAQLSLLGRILLCKGVDEFNKNYDENTIKYTKYRKPYFEDEGIQFNISHSGDMVVSVVTDKCDVGIDIEFLNDINIEDFKSQMTENEWGKIVRSSNRIGSFYCYWTQKEAVIKAHGKGLSIPLKSFEISQNKTVIEDENFFLKEIGLDDNYKCHIATNTLITQESIRIKALDLFTIMGASKNILFVNNNYYKNTI